MKIPILTTFIDWQLRRVLFEETWSFFSQHTVSALKENLSKEGLLETGPAYQSGLMIDLDGDVVTVRSRFHRIFSRTLRCNYYFVGQIRSASGGSLIRGRYRVKNLRRALSLVLLNLVSLSFIVALSVGIYGLLFLDETVSGFSGLGTYVTFFVSIFVVGLATYFVDWLLTRIEKIGRGQIHDFLQRVVHTKESQK
jgi:hypothetical protein